MIPISPDLSRTLVLGLALVVLNIFVFLVLKAAFNQVNLADILREKGVSSPAPQPVASAPTTDNASAPAWDNTSYSRVTGFVGSVIMICFLWAISNYIVYAAFYEIDNIAKLAGSLGPYFIAGSSLNGPYAMNKIASIFKS